MRADVDRLSGPVLHPSSAMVSEEKAQARTKSEKLRVKHQARTDEAPV